MSNNKEILGQFRHWAGLVVGFTGEEVGGSEKGNGEWELGLSPPARVQLRAALKMAKSFHWPF
jgi:hypothetical protein